MARKNPAAVALGKLGGRVGGRSTSEAKATAARENGRQGGRPRAKRLTCSRCGLKKPRRRFPAAGRRCDRCIADLAAAWRVKRPDRGAVRFAVKQALTAGVLVKPETCEQCGAGGYIEGHHEDYSKPLELVWLCGTCHKAKHAKRGPREKP